MAKKCKCNCVKGLPMWLGTFGDLMSLLLTFFVLLLSMATFDAKKLLEAEGSFKGAMSVLDGGVKFDPSRERVTLQAPITLQEETTDQVRKIEQADMDYSEMTSIAQGPSNVLEKGDEGFLLRLPTSGMFEKGSAELKNEDVKLFVKRVSDIVNKLPKNIVVNIIGYTDNTPLPKDSRFKTNDELSAFRALETARLLIKDGVPQDRIHVSGLGETNPIGSNNTPEGRDKNNRIEIRFEAVPPSEIPLQKSVLG